MSDPHTSIVDAAELSRVIGEFTSPNEKAVAFVSDDGSIVRVDRKIRVDNDDAPSSLGFGGVGVRCKGTISVDGVSSDNRSRIGGKQGVRFRRRLEAREACELGARWLVSLQGRALPAKNGEQGFVNHIRNVFNSRCFGIGVVIVSSSVLGGMVGHNPEIVKDGNAIAIAQTTVGGNDSCSGHASREAGR